MVSGWSSVVVLAHNFPVWDVATIVSLRWKVWSWILNLRAFSQFTWMNCYHFLVRLMMGLLSLYDEPAWFAKKGYLQIYVAWDFLMPTSDTLSRLPSLTPLLRLIHMILKTQEYEKHTIAISCPFESYKILVCFAASHPEQSIKYSNPLNFLWKSFEWAALRGLSRPVVCWFGERTRSL